MPNIIDVHAREVLDSRGNLTVEVEVVTDSLAYGRAIVPGGASKGDKEAFELKDQDKKRLNGLGCLKACENVNSKISKAIEDFLVFDQNKIDQILIDLDGTKNKKDLGANAILATSLAVCKAGANYFEMPLYQYIGGINSLKLPVPMMNIINGGKHASNNIDFQEYMIVPFGFNTFKESLVAGAEIFQALKELLIKNKMITSVGDEGGFAPDLMSNEEPLKYLLEAIKKAGYKPYKQIAIALDCAASEFYLKSSKKYLVNGKKISNKELITYYQELVDKYPIVSIEDPLDQNDHEGWKYLSSLLNDKLLLVGDDYFVTNKELIQKGIENDIGNAVLIKPNQIGTLSETLEAIELSKRNKYTPIISHRSGDSEDTFIADLAVGLNIPFIKTGSLSRSERTAKYNKLLRIEEDMENQIKYYGMDAFYGFDHSRFR